MRKQIEQIMNKVESGDLAYHDAVDELLLLYNVSGQLPPNNITNKEHKDLMKVLYPKDKSKRFSR